MRRHILLFLMPLVLLLTGAVAACAGHNQVRNCGYNGCPPDATITAEVKAEFNRRTELKPPNLLYVQTLNGVVYLSGQVATDLQRETAVQVARQVPYVSRVVDNIALIYTSY
jgi:enamine deaminase RidA (YjgF/YER057c/UK114 family)